MKTMTVFLLAAFAAVLAHSAEPAAVDAAPRRMMLDGAWRFSWASDASRRCDGFWLAGFDDSGWGEIDVPSCVEMRGYGSPVRPSEVRPVSMYRRTFRIPVEWDGCGVALRFDGVAGAFRVWIDGRLAGESVGDMLMYRFVVTDLLENVEDHVLAVEVSDPGVSVEGFRFTGIFRGVALEEMSDDDGADGETVAAKPPESTMPAGLAEVCYEELDPSDGIAVTADAIRKDLVMMKCSNVAAVRINPVRAHPKFREMCDELGLVVIDDESGASPGADCPVWVRPAIWRETDRADPDTGRRVRYLAEPSDFGTLRQASLPGREYLVDPLRSHATSSLAEFAHDHRPLSVFRHDDGTFAVSNRLSSASSGRFAGKWTLLEDGMEKAAGTFAVPSVTPLSTAPVVFGGLDEAIAASRPGAELFVNVEFSLAGDEPWGEKGFVVSREQVAIPPAKAEPHSVPESPGRVPRLFAEDDGDRLIVECARTTAIFDRTTGTLDALFIRGVSVVFNPAPGISGGPQLTCARAGAEGGFRESGLARLAHHPGRIVVTNGTVRVTVDVPGERGCGFVHETEYAFSAEDSVAIRNKVTPYGAMPGSIPRLGLTWRLPPRLETMVYCGRGPGANDSARRGGSLIGVWGSTVRGQFSESEPPRSVGLHSDVRWVNFVDRSGKGVRFSSPTPFSFRALHYGWEDLDLPSWLRPLPRGETILDLDVIPGADVAFGDPSRPLEWSIAVGPVSSGTGASPNALREGEAGR